MFNNLVTPNGDLFRVEGIFIANRKADSEEDVQRWQDIVSAPEFLLALSERHHLKLGEGIDVWTGKAHYDAMAAECGGWEQWAEKVAQDFDLYVTPHRRVGKATKELLLSAMLRGAVVLYYDGNATHLVVGILEVDDPRRRGKGPSWIDGWEVELDASSLTLS